MCYSINEIINILYYYSLKGFQLTTAVDDELLRCEHSAMNADAVLE